MVFWGIDSDFLSFINEKYLFPVKLSIICEKTLAIPTAINVPSAIDVKRLIKTVIIPQRIPKNNLPFFVIGEEQVIVATKKAEKSTPPERVSTEALYIASQFPTGRKNEIRKTVEMKATGI